MFFFVESVNVSKMFIESVFDPTERLSYILFSTVLAGETIDHIGAPTADVFHAVVGFLGVVTGDFPSFI